jgi:regulatory protein
LPVVSALKATKRGRIALHVDGRFVCTVSEALIARHHLFAGKELSADELAEITSEAATTRVLADAYRLLSHRARSQAELATRLAAKGHERAEVAAIVERLHGEGLLDDRAFARSFVADKRRLAGWGNERIARELARHGVDSDIVNAALHEVQADDHETELARALAALQRRTGQQTVDQAARARAFAFLRRRGFATETALQAVRLWTARLDPHADDRPPRSPPEFRLS